MAHVAIDDIKQTDISDAGNKELCLCLADIQIAGSILLMQKKIATPFTLADIDRIVDAAILNGGLATADKQNSLHGYVLSHERVAEAAGLLGYVKKYELYDASRIFALLQWGSVVELRQEGRHSMLATGWFKADTGKVYCTVSDPWPATNDTLLDCDRAMTQRMVGEGFMKDSRRITHIGYYVRRGTNWL